MVSIGRIEQLIMKITIKIFIIIIRTFLQKKVFSSSRIRLEVRSASGTPKNIQHAHISSHTSHSLPNSVFLVLRPPRSLCLSCRVKYLALNQPTLLSRVSPLSSAPRVTANRLCRANAKYETAHRITNLSTTRSQTFGRL